MGYKPNFGFRIAEFIYLYCRVEFRDDPFTNYGLI